MSSLKESLRERLLRLTEPRGAVAELCRRSKIPRAMMERYLSGPTAPTIDTFEAIAHGLGMEPWQLIHPDGPDAVVLKSPPPQEPVPVPLKDVAEAIELLQKIRSLSQEQAHLIRSLISTPLNEPELAAIQVVVNAFLQEGHDLSVFKTSIVDTLQSQITSGNGTKKR